MGASAAVLSRATPIAEFDVPKSNPQAIIAVPFRCEGDLIYTMCRKLPDCFFSPNLALTVSFLEILGIPLSLAQPARRLLLRGAEITRTMIRSKRTRSRVH